jgi:hypothetical protein
VTDFRLLPKRLNRIIMGKTDLISAAVAALLSGTLSVEAFADAPQTAIRTHFGIEVDDDTLDQIGTTFEIQLAEVRTRRIPRIGGEGGVQRGNGARDGLPRQRGGADGPILRGEEPILRRPITPGWVGCLTCT